RRCAVQDESPDGRRVAHFAHCPYRHFASHLSRGSMLAKLPADSTWFKASWYNTDDPPPCGHSIGKNLMELFCSATSPYARKAMIIMRELGVGDKIKAVSVNLDNEAGKVLPFNPLGKIPVLITDKGEAIFDSTVICEFIDREFGKNQFIPA